MVCLNWTAIVLLSALQSCNNKFCPILNAVVPETSVSVSWATMIPNGDAKNKTAANAGNKKGKDLVAFLLSLPSKIKTIHIVAVIGICAVFLGYISVAPPTDLPNWPLYRLNSKTWQSFERWGQHVKPYHIRIMTTALQHIESRALYIMAYLNVADILHEAEKPLSCEEIKSQVDEKTGLEPVYLSFLCRMLHAAAHFHYLSEDSEEKYSLTPLSEYLVSSHPKSLKNFVKLYSGDEALIISTSLSRSIFSGESGFKETYRTELLAHLKEDPVLQDVYDTGLGDYSRLHAPAIISDYPPFGSCKHICDIGGGVGSFLYELLEYYGQGIKGTNFDLPDVIKSARDFLKQKEHGKMIKLVPGNFTEKLPKFNCDCYILKDILQNWSDEDAALILTKLYGILQSGQRVLVIETVMHTGSFSEERLKSLMDLTMMAFNPSHSRLRSEEEMYFLLEQTGLVDAQTYPTRAGYSIIEAFPSKK